jgi:single-strand DNA-binding protein
MNNINIAGNVGKEPEIQYFESGQACAKFSVAVRNYKGESDWFECEAWGKTAQIAADYLHKGSRVAISGSVKIDQWEDKSSGQKRKAWKVNVNQLTLMDSKSDSQQSSRSTTADFDEPF